MNGWEEKDHFLVKTFAFSNFVYAFTFMTRVATMAEKMEHHPWWEKSHHTVIIRLTTTTGNENCITQKDVDRAGTIDELYDSMQKR